jgi:large repetitive protein
LTLFATSAVPAVAGVESSHDTIPSNSVVSAKADIERMAQLLLVNGVTPTSFRPEDSVTRAEFTAMLVRAMGLPLPGPTTGSTFTDISAGDWYYSSILAAAAHGLVSGVEEGRFTPQEKITREQMAVMLNRAYRQSHSGGDLPSGSGAETKFSDSSLIQSWAKDSVAAVLQLGIMQGVTDDTFEPGGVTTRAQAAVAMGRFVNKQE